MLGRFISLGLFVMVILMSFLIVSLKTYGSPTVPLITQGSALQLNKRLKKGQSRLLSNLKRLEEKSKRGQASDSMVKQIIRQLKRVQEVASRYHQAERNASLKLKTPVKEYLELRRRVLSLVDEREALFDRVDGRLCLRPRWARLIAKSASELKQIKIAREYSMRSYSCNGTKADRAMALSMERLIDASVTGR